MRILERTEYKVLRDKYDIIAGWGTSPIELERRYNPGLYKLDYLINGEGKQIGEVICGCEVCGPESLLNRGDERICFVIYSNLDVVICEQISTLYPKADTIVSRLVLADGDVSFEDVEEVSGSFCGRREIPHSYSRGNEDLILLNLVKKLGFEKDFPYMDIGVCHPVVRNNTYTFYDEGYRNGFLVEPNIDMVSLSKEYRPENTVIAAGAGGADASGTLPYLSRKDGLDTGINRFMQRGETVDESIYNITQVPIKSFNKIIEEDCGGVYPYVLDIDIEGMEIEVLSGIDFDRYPIKVICVENNDRAGLFSLMKEKGYIHYTSTEENWVFVREGLIG